MTAYVTTLEPTNSDDDSTAFDDDAVCLRADDGLCDGLLTERRIDQNRTVVLCEGHAAANDHLISGVVPTIQRLYPREGKTLAAD